ncbi:MAG: ubiquitin carboxyl-terminal hydrolase [Harvfovirus sp.]|uniref:ubiquitinyl hydrolase 1 n=1 Tax=Harvfovirus sp. TaxID=2487768 RepID=A0A3G5A4X7_9VIRU|nr:MAG: ubiquitin carboxyl-terminal hydrolase [Harvfovirus sp.]
MSVSGKPEGKTLFAIENGLNTCYIDALLMSLFYKHSSHLDGLLMSEPKDPMHIYLQEIIKIKFVDKVRKNISVCADVMNEIRTYACICGWKQNSPEELFEQQDVNEFYTFLLGIINNPLIEIQRQTISEALDNKSDLGAIEKIPFISLTVGGDDVLTIKELLNNWMNNNTVDVNREVFGKGGVKTVCSVKGLNIYKIMNVPTFVAISLNRFSGSKRAVSQIDIQKRIKLHHISDDHDGLRWKIHAFICHQGETVKSGHYYAVILSNENTWLIFDDKAIPCIKEIDINASDLASAIKREIVFAIYCYDETV